MSEKTIIIKEYHDGRIKKIVLNDWVIDLDVIIKELKKKKIRNAGRFIVFHISYFHIYITEYRNGINYKDYTTIFMRKETMRLLNELAGDIIYETEEVREG